MANPYATVTRDGDNFTYQHETDKEPMKLNFNSILSAAHTMGNTLDRNVSALAFMSEMITKHVDNNGDMDEGLCRGIAAICDCMNEATFHMQEVYRTEISTINKLVEG
jgi:hypothetical protein